MRFPTFFFSLRNCNKNCGKIALAAHLFCSLFTVVNLIPVQAAELQESRGLYEALANDGLTHMAFLREARFSIGGWVSAGANYNPDHPRDGSNAPVSFNYRANGFNLEQLDLFIERPTSSEPGQWDLGGRFDFMFGMDTPFTQATGHWDQHLISDSDLRFYKIALPQLYVDIQAPIANGLTAKVGRFYSIIGYESVGSPPNFFYSHPYSMKSSPFTHTGVLLSYPANGDFTLYSGAVTGADNFDQNFGAWSYLGGFNWNVRATSFALSVLNGDMSETVKDNRTYLSAVLQHQITARLHYVLQHDHGWQANAFGAGTKTAHWYSIVQYFTYDIDDKLGAGLRGEWFRDQNGVRYSAGEAGYYEVTLGLNWKPLKWLMVRPELRYDWADSAIHAYDAGEAGLIDL